MGPTFCQLRSDQQHTTITMKTLIIFSAVMAVALAQFTCDNCGEAGNRQARTGCRFFCYFDFNDSGVVTREDMKARFNADKDTPEGMTRARFIESMMTIVQFCEDEAEAGFNLIVELGGGSPDMLTENDIDTLADLFEGISGTNVITKAIFQEVYTLLYLAIGNNQCPSGY